MSRPTRLLSLLGGSLAACLFSAVAPAHAATFVNQLVFPGNSIDLSLPPGVPGGANLNRQGFFSDLYYDRFNNVYYALGDRGPGGGLISYNTRVQKFSLTVDSTTGAISNYTLLDTIFFTQNGQPFNGLNPQLLNGNAANLGLSFDPEGFAVGPNGNFYVSDEYGPSVYEFDPNGNFIRAFTPPANLISTTATGTPNYVAGRPTIVTGRQDNRGFEGLAVSPDGTTLFAMLQDPLVQEGAPDGRRSRNLRIVAYNIATGTSTAQYIYQVDDISALNASLPAGATPFGPNAQGRNIGISAIIPLTNQTFLILERDNRGFGVEDPTYLDGNVATSPNQVASKRVYYVNLAGATDVSNISLANTNTLPAGVIPVSKSTTPLLDVAALLRQANLNVPEKLEGLAIGPRVGDSYTVLLGTDNDFSVTQTGAGTQFDVCTSGTVSSQVPLNSDCPQGQSLIPGYLYSFKVSKSQLPGYLPPEEVPEPAVLGGLALVGLAGLRLKRRQQQPQ